MISKKKKEISTLIEQNLRPELSIEDFFKIIPNQYITQNMNCDFLDLYNSIIKIKKGRTKGIKIKKDIKNRFIDSYSNKMIFKRLKQYSPFPRRSTTLISLISNRENRLSIITVTRNMESGLLPYPNLTKELKELKDKKISIRKQNNIINSKKEKRTHLTIRLKDISPITLFRNLLETIEKNGNEPAFINIWILKNREKKVRIFYKIDIYFKNELELYQVNSLKEDFIRYFHSYIQARSIFDLLGPAMIGPSSSHTAGANRIGQIARNYFLALEADLTQLSPCDDIPCYIEIKLFSSFRDTGIGHKTPPAIGSGLLGYKTDSENMISYGEPDYIKKNFKLFKDIDVKFMGYKRATEEEDRRYINEQNNNIAEITLFYGENRFLITGFSIGGGNVEIRYINGVKLSKFITGKEDLPLKLYIDDKKTEIVIKSIEKGSESSSQEIPFNSFEEFLDYQEESKKDIINIIFETEYKLQKLEKDDIYSTLSRYWEIMKNSIDEKIKNPKLSPLKLTGDSANKIFNNISESSIFGDNIFSRSIAYATAVNESNAQNGLIIACPTAGSAGIVPGILKAYQEINSTPNKKIYKALMISGFLGMILFDDVTTAGADFGCQAEIGSAAAMAAGSVVYLEGGGAKEIVNAFILAIKNSLGLICDPVGGLVEVPCVKRNGIYSSLALSSAFMALSGVESFVSPDEVIMTMKEVGSRLHKDYKETAKGGLARTRDAKEINISIKLEADKYFE